jgi:cation:H+ antiporter
METLIAGALVLLGLALLAGGGEALVRAATTLAGIAGVPPAVIGLTVVAIGTSLPELVVSVVAALRGEPELAVANVVGSNIFNVAALGITALVLPLPDRGTAVRLEWPVMFAASLLCLVLARDGALDRAEGGLFVVAMALFLAYTLRPARRDVTPAQARSFAANARARDIATSAHPGASPGMAAPLLLLGVGLLMLVAGGHSLVNGAVALARLAGVTERVIGLTIVAAGTSAPELATSLVAAMRGRADVAIANMIGSNIFNVLGILGIAALLRPLPVSPAVVSSDLWWMLGTALLLLPLIHSGGRISRPEGGVLLAAYATYLVDLLTG